MHRLQRVGHLRHPWLHQRQPQNLRRLIILHTTLVERRTWWSSPLVDQLQFLRLPLQVSQQQLRRLRRRRLLSANHPLPSRLRLRLPWSRRVSRWTIYR